MLAVTQHAKTTLNFAKNYRRGKRKNERTGFSGKAFMDSDPITFVTDKVFIPYKTTDVFFWPIFYEKQKEFMRKYADEPLVKAIVPYLPYYETSSTDKGTFVKYHFRIKFRWEK